jgi:hypothetical protein
MNCATEYSGGQKIEMLTDSLGRRRMLSLLVTKILASLCPVIYSTETTLNRQRVCRALLRTAVLRRFVTLNLEALPNTRE